jgi:hypothetical protein
MILEVDLSEISLDLISAGLFLLTVISLWHSEYKNLNSAYDVRTINRACGDRFINFFLTGKRQSSDDFHLARENRGKGAYDFVLEKSRPLYQFLSRDSTGRVLDFPRGENF